MVQQSTSLDCKYCTIQIITANVLTARLSSTVKAVHQRWLISSLNSALVIVCPYQLPFYFFQHVPTFYKSGLLVSTSIALLMFFKTPDNLSASPKSSRIFVALDVVGFASVFLNISACISCFILLDRLGEIPYHAAWDSNLPLREKISVPRHRILRIYGIGALWHCVVWHCKFQASRPVLVSN